MADGLAASTPEPEPLRSDAASAAEPSAGIQAAARPAYYAARSGGWRDWWTLLHPPYTAWHLSYVVIGAALAPQVSLTTLLATLIAFFLAVGLAAHALDELNGRPLQTRISAPALVAVTVAGLAGAVALGAAGVARVGWALLPFMVVGVLLVVAYNAELFGGIIHTDLGFAAAWGAFPVLTAYAAQTGQLALAPVLAAAAALALSAAQRKLSTPGPDPPAPVGPGRGQRHARRRPGDRARPAGAAGPAGGRPAGDVLGAGAAGGRAGGRQARLAARRRRQVRGRRGAAGS